MQKFFQKPKLSSLSINSSSTIIEIFFAEKFLRPLLGFLFLPWTTIAFAIAQNELGGVSGLGLIVVALGFLADIGVIGGGARRRL